MLCILFHKQNLLVKKPFFLVNQELHHRKVKHYGYEFLYKTNNVDITKPLPGGIPSVCNNVIESMMSLGIVKFKPDQLTINQYEPGQGKKENTIIR